MIEHTDSIHKTVLLNETIEGLNLPASPLSSLGGSKDEESIIIDGTFGGGGHSIEVLKRYPKAKIIAIDQDKAVFRKAKEKFKGLEKRISFVNINFKNIDDLVNLDSVDGIILDLGLSSDQLENSGRGFSFMKDEILLMTMKENPLPEDLTARDIVNNWGEKNIADIIYGYGEEKFSRSIAKQIVEARKKKEINTTFDLINIIERAVPNGHKKGKIHFATKTFQALRIAVNDELNVLRNGLEKCFKFLKNGGRMSVISFHSLEDRIVKNFYRDMQKNGEAKIINKKVITATIVEIKSNSRSRSAKLRVIEKI
ncbi:MAG: 16S rRNA (cytosine(1402)-N(4))-methyltransferase RsmH [Candidatus Paceibacterota bacterium]